MEEKASIREEVEGGVGDIVIQECIRGARDVSEVEVHGQRAPPEGVGLQHVPLSCESVTRTWEGRIKGRDSASVIQQGLKRSYEPKPNDDDGENVGGGCQGGSKN